MSNITIQTTQSDVFPPNTNEAGDFQYGLDIITSHPAEDGAHEWTDHFEDPLLGLLQEQDTKLMSTEWMDADSLGFLDHGSHDMPLTPPTTVGSLSNNLGDSWVPDCDRGPGMCRTESYTGDTLPPSPEADVKSSEPAIQRLLDLQSLLFVRRMAKPQEIDGLSTLINTTDVDLPHRQHHGARHQMLPLSQPTQRHTLQQNYKTSISISRHPVMHL
ncbi:hypothetical protein CSPAE12_03840 [Colletotrichum incanum]|nr:hypothetical protein CSPAE12_03840 [Colletotrichum incanum]